MDHQTSIDAGLLKKMFLGGAKSLEESRDWINELNVFPVPDGDTGTNMTMTILSAARDVNALSDPKMGDLARAIASGSLKGARGNSGVILSQLLRGFTRVIAEKDRLDVEILAEAMHRAVETAYKAVMQPKEGTILTVARAAADRAEELAAEVEKLGEFMNGVIEEAEDALARTPDLLPVLKQAGVVDSGGQGLVQILKGARDAYLGKEIVFTLETTGEGSGAITRISRETEEEIRFGYCTEFIIVLDRPLKDSEEREYKDFLNTMGDSIVVVADDDIVKTHVHTNQPGVVLTRALTYGSLSRIKIDNMREEHQEKLFKDAEKLAAQQKKAEEEARKAVPRKEFGFVAVSAGEGLAAIFKDIGADQVVSGGQTMNPSTEEILAAAQQVPARNVFLLPNNSNIILAAEQAASLAGEDQKLFVVPTTTVPQGISALLNFVADLSPEENLERMMEEISAVKTVQVTYAVRDTEMYGMKIKAGDYMGIDGKRILSCGKHRDKTALKAIEKLIDEDSGVVSIYYGEGVKEEDAQALSRKVQDRNPEIEVEVRRGDQPVYAYILSVE